MSQHEVSLRFKTSVGTSDEVSYGECRHVCDVEESSHEDLDEVDHVNEDHDDHCPASGSDDCLVIFSFSHLTKSFIFTASLVFDGVAASSSARVVRPCIGLCSEAVLLRKQRKTSLHLPFCEILPSRIACIFVRACELGTAHPRGRTPRSFRYCVSLRHPNILLLS